MKSKIIKESSPKTEMKFPILMQYKNTGDIILVTDKTEENYYNGVLVYAPKTSPFYRSKDMRLCGSNTWSNNQLEVFHGSIELSND